MMEKLPEAINTCLEAPRKMLRSELAHAVRFGGATIDAR
jgi:hypothetical protein